MSPTELDQLRSTLTEHADGVQDAPVARIAAVHHRVARVRRRRAGIAAAVVAVAVTLAVVPLLPRAHPDAADQGTPARLAGREVPRTQTATGFTYRYSEGYQSRAGARRLEVDVEARRTPRLVMWASSDTTTAPALRLEDRSTGEPPEVSAAGGFDRYAYVPATGAGDHVTERLRLSQAPVHPGTPLALAVYDLTDPASAGTGNGTVVYRDRVAGESLVAARVGRRGQTDLSFRVRVPSTDVGWAVTCYGTTKWSSVGVDGQDLVGTSCDPVPQLDGGEHPDTYTGSPFPAGVRAGDTVTVRIHLSADSGHTGTVARDPDAVVGLGLYTHTAPRHRVAGTQLANLTVDGGHEWRASRWRESAPGGARLRLRLTPSDKPRLVTWAATGYRRIPFGVSATGSGPGRVEADSQGSSGGGAASSPAYVVQPGQAPTVTLETPGRARPHQRLGLVVSDLVH